MRTKTKMTLALVAAAMAFAPGLFGAVDDVVRMQATEMNRTRASAEGGAGEVKVLVIGNSIAVHGVAPAIGWTNHWGMAASAKEKDFAHLVVRGIEKKTGRNATFRIRNGYLLEGDPAHHDLAATYAQDFAWKPDYVVIALGENVKGIDKPERQTAFREALAKLGTSFRKANPSAALVYRSTFWPNELKNAQIRAAAEQTGGRYADLGDIGTHSEYRADGLFAHKGVANHPGDRGMAKMAEVILRAFDKK